MDKQMVILDEEIKRKRACRDVDGMQAVSYTHLALVCWIDFLSAGICHTREWHPYRTKTGYTDTWSRYIGRPE